MLFSLEKEACSSPYRAPSRSPYRLAYRSRTSGHDSLLRWPDSCESICRFAWIAWFSRIVSGFPSWTPFLRILRRGAKKNGESQVWGDSRESLARHENRGFSCESIHANRPDLRCESPGHLSLVIPLSDNCHSFRLQGLSLIYCFCKRSEETEFASKGGQLHYTRKLSFRALKGGCCFWSGGYFQ